MGNLSESPRRARRTGSRVAVVSLLVAASLGTSAASAWASSTGWYSDTQTVTGKAKFSGSYKWYSRGDNHGGFEVKGTLYDLNKSNKRGVMFQVKIEGYSPTVYKATMDQDRGIPDRVYYSGSQTIVHNGYYQTCQVNTITPNDCTSWKQRTNPYY